MQSHRYKKAAVAVLVAFSGLVLAACEMSPEMMQMLMGLMMGFAGSQGGAYNQGYGMMASQMGGAGGGQYSSMGYMMGSQIGQMYMASSNNTQGGRQYTDTIQQNSQMVNLMGQVASNYPTTRPTTATQPNPSPTGDQK